MDKNLASYPLIKGLDTKDATALVPADQALTLQNIVFVKGERGSLAKRFGYDALPKGIVPGIGLALFVNAPVAGQEELSIMARSTLNNPNLYSYSPTDGAWVQRDGLAPSLAISESAVGGVTVPQTGGDTDQLNGIGVYAWEQAGGVWYSVLDESSGTQLVPATLLAASANKPRVRALGSMVYVFWLSGTSLQRAGIDPSNPTATPSATGTMFGLNGNLSDHSFYDVTAVNSDVIIAATLLGGSLLIKRFSLPSWTNTATHIYATVFSQSFSACTEGSVYLIAGLATGSQTVYTASFDKTTLSPTAGTFTATIPAGNVPQVIDIQPAPIAGFFAFSQVMVQTKVVDDDPNGTSLYYYAVSTTGDPGLSTPQVFARGVGLASKQFQFTGIGGSDVCVFAVLPDTDEPVAFLLKAGGQVIAKVLQDQGGLLAGPSGIVPFVHVSGDLAFTTALSSLRYKQIVPGILNPNVPLDTFVYGVERVTSKPGVYTHAPAGPVQYIATGALLQEYDGAQVTEAGYNYAPRLPSAVMESAGIAAIPTVPQKAVYTVDQVSQIVVPFNLNDGQAIGGFISPGLGVQPGDYMTLGYGRNGAVATAACYIWFSIDGAGTDPALGGPFTGIGVECPLKSSMGATQITQTIDAALGHAIFLTPATNPATDYLVFSATDPFGGSPPFPAGPDRVYVYTNNSSTGNSLYGPPCFNRQFLVSIIRNESEGGGHLNTSVACMPVGAVISAGQYFGVPVADNAEHYFWFSVDGEGTAPPGLTATQVTISSSDSAETVNAALATAATGASFTASSAGNQTFLQAPSAGSAGVPGTPDVSSIAAPSFGHLGSGEGVINVGTGHADPGSVVVSYDAYVYETVYSDTNAQGQVAYSAPSVPLVATCPGFISGVNTGVYAVNSRTLRLTARESVNVELYRSQADEAAVLTRIDTQLNDPTVDNLTYIDTLPDTAVAGLVQLYTTGGVLPNDSPPATGFVAAVGSRVWLVDAEDGAVAWYAKAFTPGLSVAFSAFFTERVGQETGPLLAVSGIDSNIFLLGSKQIQLLSGDGPNDLGQGSFTGPTLVSPSLGIRDATSVCAYDNGVVFKSPQGIWAMGRGLALANIGNNVSGFNEDLVSKITVLPGTTEMRALSSQGRTLMWDYFYGQWSEFTNHQGVDAGVYGQKYCYLRNDGTVYVENTSYGDAGVGYGYYVEGAWYKMDDHSQAGATYQGRKRVWEFLIKGFFTGRNKVRVTIYTNYNGTTNSYTPVPDYQ